MPNSHYPDQLSKYRGFTFIVIGDLFLDAYIWGLMTDISREGPYPIIEVHHKTYHPGAAGNAAAQFAALGNTALPIGLTGADENAAILKRELKRYGIPAAGLISDGKRLTNTYTKIRAGAYPLPSQELFRLDTPSPPPPDARLEKKIIERLQSLAPRSDGILVIDHAGGVITPAILAAIGREARQHNLFLAGDSRVQLERFAGFDLMVADMEHAAVLPRVAAPEDTSISGVLRILNEDYRHKTAVLSLAGRGISARQKAGNIVQSPSFARNVVDVTGAGNTLAVTMSLGLAAGLPLRDCVGIASYATALAVEKVGTTPVAGDELRMRVEVETIGKTGKKIIPNSKLPHVVRALQISGKKVVWTNGCFDILHLGHIFYLEHAKKAGDVLIVGLNSDHSIHELKGPGRPIVPEKERARVLSALECVDYVTIFNEVTPLNLLRKIRPDRYVKGGDYTIDTINQDERRLMERLGIEIVLMPGIEGASTTNVIAKILGKK